MKTNSDQFPITTKNGSCVVKIYKESKASGIYYRVSFYKGGKRCGLSFPDLEEAKKEATAKARQLSRGDLEALQISGKDRLIYSRALEVIRPFEISLDAASLEFAEAKKILEGLPLQEAAKFYMRHHGHQIKSKQVGEAVAEMIAAKKENGLSEVYIADLRYQLGKLAAAFHCEVNAISQDDLRTFFDSLKLSPRGFNNTLSTIRTFFGFAKDRRWLSKESELLTGIEKRKAKSEPVEIFTPSEMEEILTNCSDDLRPCIAIAAFAGPRQAEILRLDWSDLYRRPGFIEIAAGQAKTSARRLVPIQANLAQWLSNCEEKSGPVWPKSSPWFSESLRDTADAINAARLKKSKKATLFKWKHNGLRHSYISYRLAEIQDVNKVALEAGNSAKMIFQHYRELVTPDEAKEWFSILPSKI